MTDTTGPKKTRKTKKPAIRKADPAPPSNESTTRAVADIPAEEGFLGKYSSLGRQKDDPQR